jgi:hypothetical protein
MRRIWHAMALPVKQRLGWAAAASVVLPWLGGEAAKTFVQPGLADDPVRASHFIDILVVSVTVFALTMVFTALIGCLVTTSLKGPRYLGDPFPGTSDDD